MTEPKLKACPFCGQSASIVQCGDRRQSTIYRCDGCGCSLETGEEWGHGAAWNRRAPALDTLPVSQDGQGPIRAMSAPDGHSSCPSVTVAGVDLDAWEKVARAADRGANGGGWSIDPIPNYQGDPDLVGSAIVSPAVMIAEVRGATQIDGKRCPNANLAEHIATFDPPTVLKLIALARPSRPTPEAEVEAVRLAIARIIEPVAPHILDGMLERAAPENHAQIIKNWFGCDVLGKTDAILSLPRTIGDREDQGSSRADIAVSEGDTPAQSPAGGEG